MPFTQQTPNRGGRLRVGQQRLLGDRDHAGMLRWIETPALAPQRPGLAEGAEVLPIVGDENTTELGRGDELRGVEGGDVTTFLRSEHIVTAWFEEKTKGGFDIGVKI